jgi:hypothetical protein
VAVLEFRDGPGWQFHHDFHGIPAPVFHRALDEAITSYPEG